MTTIVTRSGKGAALTHTEVDANFTNLNTNKAEVSTVLLASEKGAASGVAPLDATSKISSTYLPSYVDDVLEYANYAALPATGETGKIYVALDTNKTYRWSGSAYIYITSGAVDSVAGKTGVVTLDKTDVGLSNVSNTAQVTSVTGTSPIISSGGVTPSISISAATTTDAGSMSAADKAKIDAVTGTNTGDETASTIKTKLGITTLSGSNTGDQTIPTTLPASDVYAWAKAATKPTYTANDVGLGNVTNTSDTSKPISTATQTALDLKAPLASPTFTGTTTAANLAYTGTLTGSTGILNIGSGQVYKDASGNVGIGTTSPSAKLNVSENTNAQSWLALRNTNAGSSASSGVLFGNDVSAVYGAMYVNSSTNTGFGGGNSINLGSYGAYPLTLFTSSLERMRITSAGGISFGSSGTAYGTSGQVLSSAGNAAPTWINQSSIAAGTASNITAYTINQNVGTANTVQHSDITTARVGSLTTGYMYYGNTGTKYAGFDGTNFVTSMPMNFNIMGSSASCTGNAATSSSCTGNAATATTATNQSGGTVNATTGAFSGTTSFPSATGAFNIQNGTGDGASFTVYNTAIHSHWGIGFRDYQDLTTVKAYIDCRSGNIGTSGAFVGNVTGNISGSSGSCTGNAATVTNGVYNNGGTYSINVTGSSGSCTGNAATSSDSIGTGQTWQDLTASRAKTTTYTNSTGRTIALAVTFNAAGSGAGIAYTINSVQVYQATFSATAGAGSGGGFILVPSGATYSATASGTLRAWFELR